MPEKNTFVAGLSRRLRLLVGRRMPHPERRQQEQSHAGALATVAEHSRLQV
jgi:hypothetical protein